MFYGFLLDSLAISSFINMTTASTSKMYTTTHRTESEWSRPRSLQL